MTDMRLFAYFGLFVYAFLQICFDKWSQDLIFE